MSQPASHTAIYARISDDRQDGAGVARQLADSAALVAKNGWGPAREYVDNNVSAFAFNGKGRPAYNALVAAVKSGEVNRIVVWHADRLYRRPRELEDLVDLADQGRVQITSVYSGDMDLSTSDGRLVARMLIAVASKESEDKARRVKRAKQQAREQGLPSGGVRGFGWRDKMTPDPREAQQLSEAIAALLAGASMGDIVRKWNVQGIAQPQTGKARWTVGNVRQLLRNPRNAGLMSHRPTVIVNGKERYGPPEIIGLARWPAIIDRDRWERLQTVLEHRGRNGRVPRRRSLLTGRVVCGACGSTMARGSSPGPKGETRHIWRCPSRPGQPGRKPSCGGVSIDAAGLERLLTEATLQRADTTALDAMVARQGKQGKDGARLVAALEVLDQRLDAASDSYEKGKLPLRAFERVSANIEREREHLQRQLGTVTSVSVAAPFVGKRGALRRAWPSLTIDQQRQMIGIVLGQVVISPAIPGPGRKGFDPRRVRVKAVVEKRRARKA